MGCLIYASKKRQIEERRGRRDENGEAMYAGIADVRKTKPERRVLVVDDSKLSRNVIKELLAKRQWEFIEVGSGEECLRVAKRYKVDLVFMDQRMPGMSGDETVQRLWADGSIGADVPVIAVGSSIRKENEKEFCEKGYAACLAKPIQANRLEEILAQVFTGAEEPACEEEVPELEGFSYQKGLDYFDGKEAPYRETLVLFADLWEERREQLRQFLDEENMEEYAILIHAIKGDARTLGADAFGELAYRQELSAKEGNVQAIRAGFDRVIATGDKTAMYFKGMFS